jgi:monoamine oxidase
VALNWISCERTLEGGALLAGAVESGRDAATEVGARLRDADR